MLAKRYLNGGEEEQRSALASRRRDYLAEFVTTSERSYGGIADAGGKADVRRYNKFFKFASESVEKFVYIKKKL